jgi:hypothetical protein
MTEETRPGFFIKESVGDALDGDNDAAIAVLRTLAELDSGRTGPGRDAGPGTGDDCGGFDFGYDVSARQAAAGVNPAPSDCATPPGGCSRSARRRTCTAHRARA